MLKDSKMLSWKKAEKEALLHSQLLTEFRGQAFRKYAFLDKKSGKNSKFRRRKKPAWLRPFIKRICVQFTTCLLV